MSQPPGIHLQGKFSIGGAVLFDAALSVPGGKWTCLLGPSGVGKSTVLRLILGLNTGGQFDGTIAADDNNLLENRLSYMAQSDLLMPWLNVSDNITLGARLRGEQPDQAKAAELLKRVGLEDHAHKTPAKLSGGMRQRVALARTLMEDRPIVLLDEPFSALDAGTRADMQELAAEVLKDKTVLLVTHDPAEATRLGHQVVVMSANAFEPWPLPKTKPVRKVDAPQTLRCQSELLSHLRGVTA